MSISSSVQFNGIDKVLDAYQFRNAAAWSLWQNRQFLFKFEGDDIAEGAAQLQTILNAISDSPAVYTLKVYEDLKGVKITDKLAADGSFNFRMKEQAVAGASDNSIVHLLQQIRVDQAELKQRLDMQEAEDPENGSLGAIGMVKEVLSIPGVPEILSGIVARFLNPVSAQPAALAGVPAQAAQAVEVSEQEVERLLSAYVAIREKMPEALELLETLGDMALNDPKKFAKVKAGISMFV